jgi:hypothetical protein
MAVLQHSSRLKFHVSRKCRLISMFTQNVTGFYLQTVQIKFMMAFDQQQRYLQSYKNFK